VCERLDALLDAHIVTCDPVQMEVLARASLLDAHIVTCDPVQMEVLARATDERHLDELRRLLAWASVVPTGPTDSEDAAGLYRTCR
jgi:hypothetical protein